VAPRIAIGDLRAAVVRAVIDDDQLEIGKALAQDRLDRLRQIGRRVQHRHDDRDSGFHQSAGGTTSSGYQVTAEIGATDWLRYPAGFRSGQNLDFRLDPLLLRPSVRCDLRRWVIRWLSHRCLPPMTVASAVRRRCFARSAWRRTPAPPESRVPCWCL